MASTLQPLSSTPATAEVAHGISRYLDASFLSRRKIRSDTISVSCLLEIGIFLDQRYQSDASLKFQASHDITIRRLGAARQRDGTLCDNDDQQVNP